MRVTKHHTNATPPPFETERFSVAVTSGSAIARVRVSGEIDAATSLQLGPSLLAAGEGGRTVQLDLSATSFIDSAGIRVLVRSMWDLREAGSGLVLVAASDSAENILRITGILDVLKDPAP